MDSKSAGETSNRNLETIVIFFEFALVSSNIVSLHLNKSRTFFTTCPYVYFYECVASFGKNRYTAFRNSKVGVCRKKKVHICIYICCCVKSLKTDIQYLWRYSLTYAESLSLKLQTRQTGRRDAHIYERVPMQNSWIQSNYCAYCNDHDLNTWQQ